MEILVWQMLVHMSQAKLSQDACKDKEKSIDHLPCGVCKNIGFQRKRHL